MARLDYSTIENAIQTMLLNDSTLAGVSVLVEQEVVHTEADTVVITLTKRDALDTMQSMSAGKRIKFQVIYTLECFSFNFDVKTARANRDNLLGKVEVALMHDHTFANAQVETSWITSGQFGEGRSAGAGPFFAGGSIELVVVATAIG